MELWRLKPIHEEAKQWKNSQFKGPIVVRAPTVHKARELVKHSVAKQSFAEKTPLNPWMQPDLVLCKRLKDSAYAEEGPDKILEPKRSMSGVEFDSQTRGSEGYDVIRGRQIGNPISMKTL